jgi:hypothetical protein
MLWFFGFAFGCRHRRRSVVFTIKKRTYQVCLNCGHESEYSWELMERTRTDVARNDHSRLRSIGRAEVPSFDPAGSTASTS